LCLKLKKGGYYGCTKGGFFLTAFCQSSSNVLTARTITVVLKWVFVAETEGFRGDPLRYYCSSIGTIETTAAKIKSGVAERIKHYQRFLIMTINTQLILSAQRFLSSPSFLSMVWARTAVYSDRFLQSSDSYRLQVFMVLLDSTL
jgi:hypothetical protein